MYCLVTYFNFEGVNFVNCIKIKEHLSAGMGIMIFDLIDSLVGVNT